MDKYAIETNLLTKKYRHTTAVDQISLQIVQGEIFGLIGENGAGKSTLMKIILGVLNGYEGTVLIDGCDHRRWVRRHNFGYVPQKESFDPLFPATAGDAVRLGLMKRRLFLPRDAKKRTAAALEFVGLPGFESRFIGELSGGEFQRVLLARAVAADSDYFFLDEPEANVDKKGVSMLYSILTRLKEEGKTVVNISHDLQTAVAASDTIVCLNKTLHSHTKPELLSAEIVRRTFGNAVRLLEKDHV